MPLVVSNMDNLFLIIESEHLELALKNFSYGVLENETFEKHFGKPAKEEGGGVGEEGFQKIAEKIRYLRRDAFLDDP